MAKLEPKVDENGEPTETEEEYQERLIKVFEKFIKDYFIDTNLFKVTQLNEFNLNSINIKEGGNENSAMCFIPLELNEYIIKFNDNIVDGSAYPDVIIPLNDEYIGYKIYIKSLQQ